MDILEEVVIWATNTSIQSQNRPKMARKKDAGSPARKRDPSQTLLDQIEKDRVYDRILRTNNQENLGSKRTIFRPIPRSNSNNHLDYNHSNPVDLKKEREKCKLQEQPGNLFTFKK